MIVEGNDRSADVELDREGQSSQSPYKAPEAQGFSLGRKAPPFFFLKNFDVYVLDFIHCFAIIDLWKRNIDQRGLMFS